MQNMKKILAAAALAFALSAAPAFADTMQNAFGNTVVVTYANGSSAQYQFNEDGTFTGIAPGGTTMRGRWAVEADQLCLIPPGGQAPSCLALAADKNVGDSWTQTGSSGAEITVTLQEGR